MSKRTVFSIRVPVSRPLSDHIMRVHNSFAELCKSVETAYEQERGRKPTNPNITFAVARKLGGNGSAKNIVKEMW